MRREAASPQAPPEAPRPDELPFGVPDESDLPGFPDDEPSPGEDPSRPDEEPLTVP